MFLVAIHVFIGMSVRWVKEVYFQNNKPMQFTFKSIVLALKTDFFFVLGWQCHLPSTKGP